MSNQVLDLSNVINISILTTQQGLGLPNINTVALLTKDAPLSWGGSEAFRIYTNAASVGIDFGTGSNAYKIASSFFAQQPNPLSTNGYLTVIPRTGGGTEKVETAIARVLNSVYFFGVLVDEKLSGGDLANAATYMQTIDKVLFYASDAAADYAPGGALDLLRSNSETHTRGLFYKTSTALDTQKFAAAYAARALSTDFSGSNTTQTLHLKSLAGINPDQNVDQTALVALQAAGVDCYVSVSGVSSLFTSGLNGFFDEIYNELWLKFALQTAGYNYLRQTSTKVPQTELGIEGLKNEYRKVCAQAARNGFIGPGFWTSSTVFGDPESLLRNIQDTGYYVYSQPVTAQLQADREARKAPLIQLAVKSQGAVHSSNVIVNVNL